MKKPHICFAIAGFCFGAAQNGSGQPVDGCSNSICKHSNICQHCKMADSTAVSDTLAKVKTNFFQAIQITGGQLTVPFKIRPSAEHGTFRLTTDVTLGAFIGLTRRLPGKKEHYITIPMTAGLTFINLNNNNTTLDFAANDGGETDVVPGLTWSSGIILQLDQYNLGLIFGKDYASEVGNQWLYHRKIWWSFGLGFSFTQ